MKLYGKILLVILITLICAHSILLFTREQQVKHKIAAIKASGAPTSWAELSGPKIPDSENGAMILEKIFDEYDPPTFQGGKSSLDGFTWVELRESNPALWNEVRQALMKQKPIIDQIEVAMSRPKCKFRTGGEYSIESFDEIFPKYARIRSLARLLSTNAKFNAEEGNMDEAVRSVDLGFKLGNSLRDEAMLISCLVRYATTAVASRSLQDVTQYGDLSESQARRLYNSLAKIDFYGDWVNVLQGERVVGISNRELMRKMGSNYPDPTPYLGTFHRIAWKMNHSYIGQPFLYSEEMKNLNAYDEEINAANVPYRNRHITNLRQGGSLSDRSIKAIMERTAEKRDLTVTRVHGSRVFLALLAYKARLGTYPTNLGELKNRLGWELPEDPFSGKPFIYRRQNKGFILYGLGENMKDDSGVDFRYVDIVWRMKR